MYVQGALVCLSFHIKKHLKIGKGGMILTDDREAANWFRRARYEGRTDGYPESDLDSMGWNMYMTPVDAARGLMLMQHMPACNKDLVEIYPDLTTYSLFK